MITFAENKSSWQYMKESGLPVLIYGMGNGADKIIDRLNELNIHVSGVSSSDEFVRGQQFRGFTVKKLSEFSGDFIIAVSFGTEREEVIEHILSLNEKYDLLYPVVPVYGDEIPDESFFEKYSDKIDKAYDLFEEDSKQIYISCLNFIYSGRVKYLTETEQSKDYVFNNIIRLNDSETYLDLGAYRGDTVEEFLKYSDGKYKEIIAVEPDIKNFNKMIEKYADLPYFTGVNKAIGKNDGIVYFNSFAGRNSSASSSGKPVECTTIDTLSANRNISYIKFDVEGFEKEAIHGGQNTLKAQKPLLNVAVYHRSNDIFEIPLLIHSINPDYKINLCHHKALPCWDTNIYCV